MVNKLNPARMITSSPGCPSDGPATEIEPPADDIVALSTRIDDILGYTTGGQPGLLSVQQLFALHVKQSTAFLG